MRQKYSREKRNCEVKRRNKTAVLRDWVYYERLHFLDSFIQPRAYVVVKYSRFAFVYYFNSNFRTYTNDRFVEEDDDTNGLDENGIEDTNEASGDTSQAIDIDVEEGINVDEIGPFPIDSNDTGLQDACMELDQTNPDHHQSDENIFIRRERVVSAYSQEESTIEYQSFTAPDVTSVEIETAGDIEIHQPSENCQELDDTTIVNIDNYVSPHPGTSSSSKNTIIPSYPSRCYDPKSGEIVIARIEKPVNHQLNDVRNSSQQQQFSSIEKTTTASAQPARSNKTIQPNTSSAPTTFRPNQLHSTRRSTIVPTKPSTAKIVPVAPALPSSKEKQFEAIRQRMDSCLTAITNKVSDKTQRSPHGPFLSYLGTRLPSVPKENIPKLEREILDLVDQYAM